MVSFYKVALGLAAITTSFALPFDDPAPRIQTRDPSDFQLGASHPLMLARREEQANGKTNFVQNYQPGGLSKAVNFTYESNEFSVDFDTHEDFIVGVGWDPGMTSPIKYGGSFKVTHGQALLSIYGWTTDPLVEYSIVQDSVGYLPNGTFKGVFESDGALYSIWEERRVNAPSIEGTQTFNHYISFRLGGTSVGTVTVANHFKEWKKHGMILGDLSLQVLAVESWHGAGSVRQFVGI